MIDLHTHTLFSDGELSPSELVRRAQVNGYQAIALTDHADFTNLEFLLRGAKKARYLEEGYDIKVLAGVEITHVPPKFIARLAKQAKELGSGHRRRTRRIARRAGSAFNELSGGRMP